MDPRQDADINRDGSTRPARAGFRWLETSPRQTQAAPSRPHADRQQGLRVPHRQAGEPQADMQAAPCMLPAGVEGRCRQHQAGSGRPQTGHIQAPGKPQAGPLLASSSPEDPRAGFRQVNR